MVDTLAPKKIFTQRELDKKLMPIERQQTAIRPRASLAASTYNPVLDTNSALMENIVKPEVTTQPIKEIGQVTAEQDQEVSSTDETQDIKQTGKQVEQDSNQGLGSKPIAYAAEGFEDKIIDRPVVVGERGMEMIVPTGKGKFTVINNEALKGLMTKVNGDGSDIDLSKDTVSEFKNNDGTNEAAITGNDNTPDPKIGSYETMKLLDMLEEQGEDPSNKDLRKSIMEYIEGGDNTYYDELLNPPEVEIIPEEKVQPLMGKDEV